MTGEATAFVLPSLAHGGAQKVFVELVTYLFEKGEDVRLFVLIEEGELIEQLPPNCPVEYIGKSNSCKILCLRDPQATACNSN